MDVATVSVLQLQAFVAAKCQIASLPKIQSLFSIWWRSVTGGRSHNSNVEAAKFCRSKVTDNASPKPVTFLDLMSALAYLQFQCCSCKISSQQSVRQCIFLKPVTFLDLMEEVTGGRSHNSVIKLQSFVEARWQITPLPNRLLFSSWRTSITGGQSWKILSQQSDR